MYAQAVAAAGAADAAFTGLDAEMKLELDLLAEQEHEGGQQDLSSDEGSDSEGSSGSGSGSEEGGRGSEVASGDRGGGGSKDGHSLTDSSTCYYAVKVTVTVTVTVWPPFFIL